MPTLLPVSRARWFWIWASGDSVSNGAVIDEGFSSVKGLGSKVAKGLDDGGRVDVISDEEMGSVEDAETGDVADADAAIIPPSALKRLE